jgi:hypothetical protein
MQSVNRFLNANLKVADIDRKLREVYGEHAMGDSMVWKWVRRFNEGSEMWMKIHGSADHLCLMKIWYVQQKRRFNRKVDSPFCHFPCIFHKFHGHFFTKLCLMTVFQKFCSHWVLKTLSEEHKMKRQASALTFLTGYSEQGNDLLSHKKLRHAIKNRDVACFIGVLWCFMIMRAHTLWPQCKISSRHLSENNLIIPSTAQA